jgi:hypothetical protein
VGSNIAWNSRSRKYDLVKKSFPSCISSETLKPLEILFKNGTISDAIFGIFHIHGYNYSLSSPTLARGFAASLKKERFGPPGRNVQAARSNSL